MNTKHKVTLPRALEILRSRGISLHKLYKCEQQLFGGGGLGESNACVQRTCIVNSRRVARVVRLHTDTKSCILILHLPLIMEEIIINPQQDMSCIIIFKK